MFLCAFVVWSPSRGVSRRPNTHFYLKILGLMSNERDCDLCMLQPTKKFRLFFSCSLDALLCHIDMHAHVLSIVLVAPTPTTINTEKKNNRTRISRQ